MKAVAGCIVTESLIKYADAYDDYVTGAGNEKFGVDVFKETVEEAERHWKSRAPVIDSRTGKGQAKYR